MPFLKELFLLLVLFSCAHSSIAGVTIMGTRVIFPGNEKEISIRTNNKGDKPALVQIWIDDGKANADLNSVKVPFLVTPPVFRVEPGKGQSLRLIYNGMSLPQDRESLYWFNLLEIPPVNKNITAKNRLELAFRTRIKIFYRPHNLKENSIEVFNRLQWSTVSDPKKGTGIKITNPTPYHFSFDTGTFTLGDKKYFMNMDMVSPGYSKEFYADKGAAPAGNISQVTVYVLNDYGTAVEKTMLNQAGKFIEKKS